VSDLIATPADTYTQNVFAVMISRYPHQTKEYDLTLLETFVLYFSYNIGGRFLHQRSLVIVSSWPGTSLSDKWLHIQSSIFRFTKDLYFVNGIIWKRDCVHSNRILCSQKICGVPCRFTFTFKRYVINYNILSIWTFITIYVYCIVISSMDFFHTNYIGSHHQ